MADTEILLGEEGSPKVAQLSNLGPLFGRVEGFERHRVPRWLNCCPRPPDFRVPKAARSPDDSFNRILWIFFLLLISLKICEYSLILSRFFGLWLIYLIDLIYLLCWGGVVVLVMFVAVAACIRRKKMKKTEFTPPRKEEVKTISGLIQHV